MGTYTPGQWKVACSLCGKEQLAQAMVKNWQGMYRCPEHNEPRHPQDFVRGSKDVQTVPFSQPPNEIFLAICDREGVSAVPALALPGCCIPNTPYNT